MTTIQSKAVYPTQPGALRETLEEHLSAAHPEPIEGEILALIVPDSNLLTGAPAAAAAYSLLDGRQDEYRTILVVAPSHDGSFDRIAICKVNEYHTPLGEVPIDDRTRNELCDEDDDIYIDDRGHYHTEGVDAQLPYLQHVLGEELKVVPIVMGNETPAFCHELGIAVGEVMYGERMLLVASADLLELGEGVFERFTEALETFDTSTLMHLLASEQIRMEGMGAIITAVIAAKHRRANRARIIHLTPPSGKDIGAMACVLWRE
jgi:MEMO1 family protein